MTNTPDVLTKDVADLGVAMMLAQSRGLVGAESWVRDGSWATKGLYPLKHRVHCAKVGVLGLGRIGFEVAKRLAGFDMEIAYSDVSAKDYAPDWSYIPDPVALARHADFLFVTLAALDDTRHIAGMMCWTRPAPKAWSSTFPAPSISTKTRFWTRWKMAGLVLAAT